MDEYRVPGGHFQTELTVVNSRFVTTVEMAPTVDVARAVLQSIREAMPDANHHVYAFRVGHGNSVIEGMSDDGEPSGTAGPPVLAVLRGANLGDVIVVVSRFFGGTKLGTGGLVRAYSDAARQALQAVPTELKVPRQLLGMELPYPLYQSARRLIHEHEGVIEDQTFAEAVTVLARFPIKRVDGFTHALADLSAGRVDVVVME